MAIWLDLIVARAGSDDPAVVTESGVWSGRDLVAHAASAVDFLDAIDAPRGTPIVALLTCTATAFALTIAGAGTDRALAPLGPRLTVSELAPCVGPLDAKVIVAESQFAELGEALAQRAGLRLEILPDLKPSTNEFVVEVGPEHTAAILHTSGTTGVPKAVRYTQGRLVHRVRVNSALVGLGPGTVFASASPFHHIAGLGTFFVALGSGAAMMPMPRFDVDTYRGLSSAGVTHALIVPTMIEVLLAADALSSPGLKVLQYGASPIHPDTLARAIKALPGVKFVNLFGQTEGSPVTGLTMHDHEVVAATKPHILASVGRPVPGVEMLIDSPDEHGVGEVWAKAEHFFRPDADGWLRTGDLGRVDEDGYLYLSGRKGDKIIRGGENVYPIEVETVLARHPAIAEACVFGLSDRVYGETVNAALVAPVGLTTRPTDDELRTFARSQLGGFKVPTSWEWVAELPRNAGGKVLRRQIISQRTKLQDVETS